MSPEERAKHVCGILAVEGVSHFGEDWERLQKLIAQAIRDAEDAALERAATKCGEEINNGHSDEDRAGDFVCEKLGKGIRALKHQKGTQ